MVIKKDIVNRPWHRDYFKNVPVYNNIFHLIFTRCVIFCLWHRASISLREKRHIIVITINNNEQLVLCYRRSFSFIIQKSNLHEYYIYPVRNKVLSYTLYVFKELNVDSKQNATFRAERSICIGFIPKWIEFRDNEHFICLK